MADESASAPEQSTQLPDEPGLAEAVAELRTMMTDIRQLEASVFTRTQWGRRHGVTFGGSRDEYGVLGYDDIITNQQYRAEYERGGLAGRIVDVMPEATWRGEPAMELIEDEDPKNTTDFEAAWVALEKKHQINAKLLRVDKLSRLSTYAILLIGAEGDWSTPLPKARKGGESLLYLMPFLGGGGPGGNNVEKTVAAGADATIHEYETDSKSPRFGLPKSYMLKRTDVAAPDWGRPVHYTRVVHVAEGLLDDEVFGQPALQRVWNLLADLRKVTGGGAEAFWLRANQGLHLDLDKDMALDDAAGTVAALKEQAENYKHQLTRWLRTRGVKATPLGSDVANFGPPADAIITQIAGSKSIPKRILTGSEMGELASSQDRENFRDQIIGRQTQYAGPYIVKPLVDRLIEFGYLPRPQNPEGYVVRWPHIQVMTEQEKADGAQKWSQTKIGEDPVFTDAEIRDHFQGLPPLSDEQRQEIADRKAEAVKRQQEAMAAAKPPSDKRVPPEDEERRQEKKQKANAIVEIRAAQDKARKFSSTQIQLPPVLAENLLAFGKSIPAIDLCEEEGGLEDDAHVTVKYGIHTNNVADVRKVLATYVGPIRITLGKTQLFESADYDVLYVAVESPDLAALNQRLSASLEVTDTHPVYTPHATVAYLKKGAGAKYVGKSNLEGMSASVGFVRFSPAAGDDVDIRITGRNERGTFAPVDERYAGDYEGHPFRGNQWKGGEGNGSPDKPAISVNVATAHKGGVWAVTHFSDDAGRKFTADRHAYFHPAADFDPSNLTDADGVLIEGTLTLKNPKVVSSDESVNATPSDVESWKAAGHDGIVNEEGWEVIAFNPSASFKEAKRRDNPYKGRILSSKTAELELLKVLATAIEVGDQDIVNRLVGLSASLPDLELVAEAVHDSWLANKRKLGKTSRKSESGEELMVPYAQLSEAAKELDRVTVRAVYAAIKAAAK